MYSICVYSIYNIYIYYERIILKIMRLQALITNLVKHVVICRIGQIDTNVHNIKNKKLS